MGRHSEFAWHTVDWKKPDIIIATELGTSRQSVWNWRRRLKRKPPTPRPMGDSGELRRQLPMRYKFSNLLIADLPLRKALDRYLSRRGLGRDITLCRLILWLAAQDPVTQNLVVGPLHTRPKLGGRRVLEAIAKAGR